MAPIDSESSDSGDGVFRVGRYQLSKDPVGNVEIIDRERGRVIKVSDFDDASDLEWLIHEGWLNKLCARCIRVALGDLPELSMSWHCFKNRRFPDGDSLLEEACFDPEKDCFVSRYVNESTGGTQWR